MVTHLYRDFLTSPQKYVAAQKAWLDLWAEVSGDLQTSSGDWAQPWAANRMADGSELRDGNPIFSAFSARLGRALRVIQHEPEDEGLELVWWIDSTVGDGGSDVEELIISCALSKEAERLAGSLIKTWISGGVLLAEETNAAEAD